MKCIYCGKEIELGEFCDTICEENYYLALCESFDIPEKFGTSKKDYLAWLENY